MFQIAMQLDSVVLSCGTDLALLQDDKRTGLKGGITISYRRLKFEAVEPDLFDHSV